MKKTILLFSSILCFKVALQAQNVGIGITTPLENLHVDSTIKIGKSTTLNTTSNPGRKNLLKFGDGSYVTIGEEVTDDKMYIRYGDLIFLKANGASGNGYIGINTETPSAQLDISGTLRIRGNGAATGNVLTSDANGNATWQAPSGGAAVGFRGRIDNNLDVTQAAGELQLAGFTEEFDDGSGFNGTTGAFTAPSAGVYQFVVNLNWYQSTNTTGTSIIVARLYVNGNIIEQTNNIFTNNTSYSQLQNITSIYKLSAGDVVTVRVDPQVSYTYTIVGSGSTAGRFSGAKLY